MKKNYTIKTFIVLLVMAAMNMSAQLSGLYTINSGAPVSSTNYTSVSSFANDLNIMGVAGPVTVNIAPNSGPYNGQITFNVISGASAINNIVVEGNGNTVTWSSSNPASAWTILLNGTDYLTVKNLTVNATGSNAYACILVGGADNNAFTNVRFSVPAILPVQTTSRLYSAEVVPTILPPATRATTTCLPTVPFSVGISAWCITV